LEGTALRIAHARAESAIGIWTDSVYANLKRAWLLGSSRSWSSLAMLSNLHNVEHKAACRRQDGTLIQPVQLDKKVTGTHWLHASWASVVSRHLASVRQSSDCHTTTPLIQVQVRQMYLASPNCCTSG